MGAEEIVLVAKEAKVTSAELWHLRMGHLNSHDVVKLKSRAHGMRFEGEPCFCQTCVMAKMKSTPFQNQGQKDKATGKRWRQGGRHKSDAAEFLQHLLTRLNTTASPPGKVETFTSDHGGEVLSNAFRTWLKMIGVFHMTATVREPNYNAVIERESAVMENMSFAMLHHAKKPNFYWDYAFDWANYILDRCPRRSNNGAITQ